MIDLKEYLENKLRAVISGWNNEEDIYAISFFVYSNEAYEYDGYTNLSMFSISYNTERDCDCSDKFSEKRWNYAFWRQNETPIIDIYSDEESVKILLDWYKENGICNIGYEDSETCYDENMQYIGKGPIGYYELLSEITDVAKRLQDSGFIKNKFGIELPIIIHDLEYPWYIIEANKKANSHGEAEAFLEAMRKMGFC